MTAPRRAHDDFVPDADFVDGLTGFGVLLDRQAAAIEALALAAAPGPALVPDDHPVVLLMLGLVGLRHAAGASLGAALGAAGDGGEPVAATGGDGRGLLR